MTDQYLTEHDLAKLLSVELDDIKNWIDHGIITKEAFIKVGDSYRFEKEKTLHALHNMDIDSLTPYEELREDFISRLQEMESYRSALTEFFKAFSKELKSITPDEFFDDWNWEPTPHLILEAISLRDQFPGKEKLFDDFITQVELTNFEGFRIGQKLDNLCREFFSDGRGLDDVVIENAIGWRELTQEGLGENPMTFDEITKAQIFSVDKNNPLNPYFIERLHETFELVAWFETPEEVTSKPETATVTAIHKTWIEVDTEYETGGRIPKFRLTDQNGDLSIDVGDHLEVVVQKSLLKFPRAN